MKKGSLPY